MTVGGRLRRKLVEGRGEEELCVVVATLAPADEAEVRNHLPLVLLVAQLPKEGERLFELLNGQRDAAGMDESQSKVVERQSLGVTVTELTHDRQRETMLLGSLLVIAFASQLCPELVESTRAVGRGRFVLANLEEGAGTTRRAADGAPEVLLKAERSQPFSHLVPAREPDSSNQGDSDEREEQDDAETGSGKHPGQQEPEPREREHATA